MRRWNGWGDDTVEYPLPQKGPEFLERHIGSSQPAKSCRPEEIVPRIPPSRLKDHPLINDDPWLRLVHARGQSFPDWTALRSGEITSFPDGVAYPASNNDVNALLDYAQSENVTLIPYGGGTSVVGHINPLHDGLPVLTVNMRHMNRLLNFDEKSSLATFGAGVSGPELEAKLRSFGFTLGHFPQSFELSTLGGWIATRSSGQQSLGYGRIEDLFAGGTLLTPQGSMTMPPHPASAAGPDLRQLVLGSEGRMGFITEATVRVSHLPEKESFHALFFPDFDQGVKAVRQIMQSKIPLSMLRLSTGIETETTLALAGHERLIGVLEHILSLRGVAENKAMLLIGFTGQGKVVKTARKEALSIAHQHHGIHVGRQFGKQWHKGRFRTPYLRNTLWNMGYGVDTLETAVPWSSVRPTMKAIEESIIDAMKFLGERVHQFTHLSHMYPYGASIYTTVIFRIAPDPDQTYQRWQAMKTAASQAIVTQGGTISHQHGVGMDHGPYLPVEKGGLGMDLLANTIQHLDPQRIMNPGKLII